MVRTILFSLMVCAVVTASPAARADGRADEPDSQPSATVVVSSYTVDLVGLGDYYARRFQDALPTFPDFVALTPLSIEDDWTRLRYDTRASSSRLYRYLQRTAEELHLPATVSLQGNVFTVQLGAATPRPLDGW